MIVNEDPTDNTPKLVSFSPNSDSGLPVLSPSLHPPLSDFQPLLDPLLSPALDPHLSTVRLFWYLFWLCVAEVAYLGAVLVNYTLVTSQVQNDGGDPPRGDGAQLPPLILLLYFSPAILVLGVAMVMFCSKRYNYVIRKVLLGAVSLALLGGLAGSSNHYFFKYKHI
jgi:hypothetical protein